MPLFRITKKLATALHVKLPREPVEVANQEHEWFADLFYFEGKKCVIWVHRPTLLGFVRPAVAAADLKNFHALFRLELIAALASLGLPASLIETFVIHGTPSYAPTNDRAVVGSMLDYRKMFAHMVGYQGGLGHADISAINAKLSDTPMSVLGMDSAVCIVRRLTERKPTMLH